MASNNIKGLTIEIGGDTTKLGKALEAVNKKAKDISSELGQINKLLKMDPKNTELLAQKQKVLADAIANTKEKLETLKKAEKQVQEQFKRGEVSEEQVRSLQREIIATTKKLDSYEKAAEETSDALKELGDSSDDVKDGAKKAEKGADKASDALDDMADSADKAGKESEGLGSKLGKVAKGGLKLLTAGLTAAIGALVASAEASREYRTEMGKLDTAFTTSGHSSQTATKTYKTLQGVLGETDQAVEAANHLAKLTDNEQDLEKWTDICTGVYATFGASLPIEGLTEAANETAKVGQVTGPLADALNWAGISEDKFNESLAACSNEQERQQLIMETLNGIYDEAADKYRETNAEIIRANQANEEWASSMAEVGAVIEPILTDVKLLGASLLQDLVPNIQIVADSFRGMLNGDEGAAENMGAALSGIFEHLLSTLTNMLPAATEMAVSLITTLASSVISMTPQLITTGVEIILALLSGVSQAIPEIVTALRDTIPEWAAAIQEGLPLLLQGVVDLLSSLVELLTEQLPVLLPLVLDTLLSLFEMLVAQLPILLPQLLTLITSLVTLIIQQLPVLIPQIVSVVTQAIQLLAQQLPVLIPQLTAALVQIITLLTQQLPVIIPMLIDACITICMAIIEALPDILVALTDALPEILVAVWDAIIMVFINLPAWFGQLFAGAVELISAAFGVIVEWFGDIWADICEVFAPVGEWFSEMFTDAWEGISDAWSGVTTFFSDIWKGIKETFSSVTTWFSDIFSEAWEAVIDVFSPAGEVFKDIKDGILEVFKTVVNGIIKGLNTVVKLPFEGLNGILDTLQNLSFLKISPFSWLTWRAPVPQIPELAQGGVLKRGQVGLLEGDGAEAVVPLEKNVEWIQRVAEEFVSQVKAAAGAFVLDSNPESRQAAPNNGPDLSGKLDKILYVLERGQILTVDGKAWVGATADLMDSALGQRRELVVRGAL